MRGRQDSPCDLFLGIKKTGSSHVRIRTGGKPAFEKLGLSDLRKALGIEDSQEHRALDDAIDAAKVYKTLLERMDLVK